MSTRYCIVRDHTIEHGSASCAARAKTLHPVGSSHESGVRHAQHHDDAEFACNAEPLVFSRAVQPISARVKGARSENFGLSAEVFKESMRWAGVSGADAAVAINHNSPTGVAKMARGEQTIPADAVYVWMRRLPALGARILAFCAAELPERYRAELPALIEEAIAKRDAIEKRRLMGGGK